ncbi:hypothetical protein CXU19_00680 [Akkermansia muciniphila]|uniref:hypothetical protein n=1 Tax=Akkermansia sp. N21169 TaxID=3040765 RepID=UPI000C9D187C|nr:hypothetical protein [Akkermansia sp. N21169]MDH3068292.1 hypothetical protein [Akkermansia sp. N21169]PNC26062.1 hypothetical protein CXU19_00680 [Akkermansia muciniphila]PNC37626.1 hypothetical protein CXU20_12620 [Akkermansia muciniphila]
MQDIVLEKPCGDGERKTPDSPYLDDISQEEARSAFVRNSSNPERFGEGLRRAYVEDLEFFLASIKKWMVGKNASRIQYELEVFRQGLKKRHLDYIHANARCGNFVISDSPDHEKESRKLRIAEAKRREILDYMERKHDEVFNKYHNRPYAWLEPSGGEERRELEYKLAVLKRMHHYMLDVNAALNRAKGDWRKREEELRAMGLSEAEMEPLLLPDVRGRVGFSPEGLARSRRYIRKTEKLLMGLIASEESTGASFHGKEGA